MMTISTHDKGLQVDRSNKAKLTDKEFSFICQFVYQTTGIVLNDNKREMVYRRLTRIIRERKFSSFSQYCQILKEYPDREKDFFINAITTNLTSFFREQHHFDYLKTTEFPTLLQGKQKLANGKKRLRIWSSASSTGEEPYSIAMTLLEVLKAELSEWDAKILATDIDSNVLNKGKNGIYDNKRVEAIPQSYLDKYFYQGKGENINNVKVAKELQQLITFKRLNLLHDWPMKGPFDVIFCRNVIIYFDKETQQDLFARYYELLAPGGLFILGHSENLGGFQKYFENSGRTMFRKPY